MTPALTPLFYFKVVLRCSAKPPSIELCIADLDIGLDVICWTHFLKTFLRCLDKLPSIPPCIGDLDIGLEDFFLDTLVQSTIAIDLSKRCCVIFYFNGVVHIISGYFVM